MKVEIDITDINAIAYAAQEMAELRGEQARTDNSPVIRSAALVQAEQYLRIAEQFYSLSRQVQETGNKP